MISDSLAQQVTALIEQLESQIADLNHRLQRLPLIQAKVFTLPPVLSEDTHQQLPYLSVETTENEPARILACRAFRQLHAPTFHSTKAVFRLPGVIVLSSKSASASVSELVQDINNTKTALSSLGKADGLNQRQRFDLFTGTHPRLVYLQTIRQLTLITTPLKSITFTWGRRPMSYEISKKEVTDKLEEMRDWHPEALLDDIPWPLAIDQEIARIHSLSDQHQLRVRRQLKPHPMANLLFQPTPDNADVSLKRQLLAHTPLIVLAKQPIKIGQLRDYDPKKPKQIRPRLLGETPISRLLAVYERRQTIPVSEISTNSSAK